MLALPMDVKIPDVPFYGHPLGIDWGRNQFLAKSDGELVARPRFLNQLHPLAEIDERPRAAESAETPKLKESTVKVFCSDFLET